MSELEKSSPKNGSDINLRHFIYLDRTRLTSYSSQLSDGIIQLRRLTENRGNRLVDNPSERVRESFRETATDGEVKLGFAAGKKTNKRNSKTTFKVSGVTSTDEYSQSFSEDKTDYDNTYITFEKQFPHGGSQHIFYWTNHASHSCRSIELACLSKSRTPLHNKRSVKSNLCYAR